MPALQVRDFPAMLYDELKEYAARNHRSIAQQTVIAVEEMLEAAESTMQFGGLEERDRMQKFGRGEMPHRHLQQVWPRSRTVSEERIRQRRQILANFDMIDWKGTPSTPEDIVAFVNEGRSERIERIMAAVDSPDFGE
jgi:hypothetical protein